METSRLASLVLCVLSIWTEPQESFKVATQGARHQKNVSRESLRAAALYISCTAARGHLLIVGTSETIFSPWPLEPNLKAVKTNSLSPRKRGRRWSWPLQTSHKKQRWPSVTHRGQAGPATSTCNSDSNFRAGSPCCQNHLLLVNGWFPGCKPLCP